MSERIYLSRRNLLVLLSKLDRKKAGEETACSIIKFQNPADPYVQTMNEVMVTAVEDADYYVTRMAGTMHPADEPDVGSSDAPSPQQTVVDLGDLTTPLLVGFKAGQEVRNLYKLDDLDSDPQVVVNVIIPDYTYSVSSSFFRGMLEQSIKATGSPIKFTEKYKFQMKQEFWNVLGGVVARAFVFSEDHK